MKAQLQSVWEALRASFWFVPACMALAAAMLAEGTVWADRNLLASLDSVAGWGYAGGPEAAQALLSAIVTAMMSVISVVFSITIVALTLAASQFGPRLPRNFMRDRGSHLTLGIFIATFVYALLLLRSIELKEGGFVPHLAVNLAIALTLLSVAALIFFIHRISYSIQADSVIGEVEDELRETIHRLFPNKDDDEAQEKNPAPDHDVSSDLPNDFEERAATIDLDRSNYLQGVDTEELLTLAIDHDLVINMLKRPGDFVPEADPILQVWPAERVDKKVEDKIRRALVSGRRRTPTQDVEFSILQLVEIAVRALSPGVNDPFTAITCIDRLGSSLRIIASRSAPSQTRYDKEGKLRVILDDTDFSGHMDAAFDQIRQNGGNSVAVFARLLEAFCVIAGQVQDKHYAKAILRHAELVRAAAQRNIPEPRDLESIEVRFQKVQKAAQKIIDEENS